MAILHKFKITEEEYFDYAVSYYNSNKLFDSLEMVGRCLDIDPDDFDFGMLRAKILFEMELYDDALKQYYKLYLRYSIIPELYLGLVQVFGALGNPQKAFYFLERLFETELDEDDEEYLDSIKEFDIKKIEKINSASKLSLYKIGKAEYDIAQEYIRNAKFDNAVKYLEAVPEQSEYYTKTLIDRAIIYMSCGKHDNALVHIDNALVIEPDNIHFLLTKCMCYYLTGNQSGFDSIVKIIEKLEIASLEQLNIITSFGMEMNNHAWVVKYAEAILELRPYHKATIQYLMQAYYNLKDYDSAKIMLSYLLKINHNDYVIKYYSLIIGDGKKETLEYTQSLQTEDIITAVDVIVPRLILSKNFEDELFSNGGEVFLEWYFSQSYAKKKINIVEKLGIEYVNFMRLQLLTENITFREKLAVLRRLLSLEKPRRRDFVVSICDEICEFDPRPPKFVEQNPPLLRLYLDLYSALSLFNDVNDTKLNRFFKLISVSLSFKVPTKLQTSAFLAAFYYKYLAVEDDMTLEETIKLFDTTMVTVTRQIYNLENIGPFKY